MNWNQLEYVMVLTKEKNITRAAKELFISQPSLSLSIQSLEKELDIKLFTRIGKEMQLTYAGSLFYEWARATLQSHEQLQFKLADITQNKRQLIRIGVSPHRSNLIMPVLMKRFYEQFPNCEIRLTERPTYVLSSLLEKDELDFMLDVAHPDRLLYQSDFLTNESILLAIPRSVEAKLLKEHPEGFDTIYLPWMADHKFIKLSEEQVLGKIAARICEVNSFLPNTVISCSNVETALSFVNQQLGSSFVPEIFEKQKLFIENVAYYPIRNFEERRQVCLVYKKDAYLSKQILYLFQLFHESVPDFYQ
ncbi:MAG: LysR family transcriptional regulator [Lachnospiraceae bacterium]|nr:LysR family transcriptional regulator [Lachnospiraceae bacterium]